MIPGTKSSLYVEEFFNLVTSYLGPCMSSRFQPDHQLFAPPKVSSGREFWVGLTSIFYSLFMHVSSCLFYCLALPECIGILIFTATIFHAT